MLGISWSQLKGRACTASVWKNMNLVEIGRKGVCLPAGNIQQLVVRRKEGSVFTCWEYQAVTVGELFTCWEYRAVSCGKEGSVFTCWEYRAVSCGKEGSVFTCWEYRAVSCRKEGSVFTCWEYQAVSCGKEGSVFTCWEYHGVDGSLQTVFIQSICLGHPLNDIQKDECRFVRTSSHSGHERCLPVGILSREQCSQLLPVKEGTVADRLQDRQRGAPPTVLLLLLLLTVARATVITAGIRKQAQARHAGTSRAAFVAGRRNACKYITHKN